MKRYTQTPFPGYSYVPGRTAHPASSPAGHSYEQPEPEVADFHPPRWHDCQAYLFGIDLFNAEFYWEAHEQFEAVWKSVGRSGSVADFLKGIIKLSAAGVKQLEGRPEGFLRHMTRAIALFEAAKRRFPQGCCGLDPNELHRAAQAELESHRLSLRLSPGLNPSVSIDQRG